MTCDAEQEGTPEQGHHHLRHNGKGVCLTVFCTRSPSSGSCLARTERPVGQLASSNDDASVGRHRCSPSGDNRPNSSLRNAKAYSEVTTSLQTESLFEMHRSAEELSVCREIQE
ncbi:hypothetical protein AVEN_86014-1 [Araneus ventricosus]|uniref:Uncharacterized protein n=1 Tax=Araneus ventricosus TaxID=182803 RepID=A0A4Y2VV81_ARAVE|nr:hypothetical protein AVEN_86014-1 [Araneus ventricosus]